MSRGARLEQPRIPGEDHRARPDPVLPWSWPEGTRVLLAVLAISAAIGIAMGRRGSGRGPEPIALRGELKLDPSRATADALAALPHIGPTLSRRIVAARAAGPFRSPEDLRARVRGIGPVTLARIAPYLRFEAGTDATPGVRSPDIVVVDAAANPDGSSEPPSPARKPPRSRTRKAKGSLVALTARGDGEASP